MQRPKRGTILALMVLTGSFFLTGLAGRRKSVGKPEQSQCAVSEDGRRRPGAWVWVVRSWGRQRSDGRLLEPGRPDLDERLAGRRDVHGWHGCRPEVQPDRCFARNGGWGAYGFNWLNAGMTDIDQRDGAGGRVGQFDFSDNAFMLSLAKQWDIASFGITGKYLHEGVGGERCVGQDESDQWLRNRSWFRPAADRRGSVRSERSGHRRQARQRRRGPGHPDRPARGSSRFGRSRV